MPKPKWLADVERNKAKRYRMCDGCIHYGNNLAGFAKHKGKERIAVFECDIHDKCFNTKYSIACDDWEQA